MDIKRPVCVFSPELISVWEDNSDSKRRISSYDTLHDYYLEIDPLIRLSPYGYKPVKSVEYKKIDQPFLNHIRNGINAVVELNEALLNFGSRSALTEKDLREVIALFTVHDLHKFTGKDWKEQFDIPVHEVMGFAKAIHADIFAPSLSPEDFHSVAIALHKQRGFHGDLSPKFNLLYPWLAIADSFASMEHPGVDAGLQKQLGLIDREMSFYYHSFTESIGILSNILHTAISDWAKDQGLICLLIFEKGVAYLGKKDIHFELSEKSQIEDIYSEFKKRLQKSHPSLTQPELLQQSIQVQGSKGLFSIENVFYFYSGLNTALSAFLAAAVLREDTTNGVRIGIDTKEKVLFVGNGSPDMQFPPAGSVDILNQFISEIKIDGTSYPVSDVVISCHGEENKPKKFTLIPDQVLIGGTEISGNIEILGTGLMTSLVGYRAHLKDDFSVDIGWDSRIISYARAISGIRMQVVTPLIESGCLPSTDVIRETCRLFGVNENLTESMASYSKSHAGEDHHAVGGFWNYAYVIARDILDRDINGVLFSRLASEQEKIAYLVSLADQFLLTITQEKREQFESDILYPYKEKLLVWISENLDINGSMLYGAFENKSNKFQAYCEGTGICRLTNDTPYDKERTGMSKDVSMLKYTFSNRLPLGSTEPELYVSVPIQIELGLRSIGHGIKKGADRLYFRLIPDYFFSSSTAKIFSQFVGLFSGDCQTNIGAIARTFLKSENSDYESMVTSLISESGRKGVLRYSGIGYEVQNSTYDIVFNKTREKDGEYWFFGCYLGLILGMVTGCRVVVGENPICMTNGDEFKEFVVLEAPHVAVKRVFGDRIRLSELPKIVEMASLLISLGYEIKMDDKAFSRYLQSFKNRWFPGSYLLKEIRRGYENGNKKGGTGTFIVHARGWRNEDGKRVSLGNPNLVELAIRLDKLGAYDMVVESIHELARLGIEVAIPRDYEPHRIEKLLRESVKAILAKKGGIFVREDYVDAVAGRLLKMMKRAGDDQFFRKPGLYDVSKTLSFAENFVDYVFLGVATGNAGKLKRAENDLADGFYAATLRMREEYFSSTKSAEDGSDAEMPNQE